MIMKNNNLIKVWELEKCPVSGLPITRKSEWTDQKFGDDDYRITMILIGTNIVYSKVWGYTHLHATKGYIDLLEKVINSNLINEEKYILIEDYTNHTGVSNRAKNHFTNYHKHNSRICGIIFCTREALFKIMIKMGSRIVRPGFPVEIVNGYESAIELTIKWQQSNIYKSPTKVNHDNIADMHIAAVESILICPVSGLPITAPAEWSEIDLGEGYSVSFRLIGDKILQTLPIGNSAKNGMRRLLEERKIFLESMGLSERSYVEIKDYGKVSGSLSKEGRMQFIEAMVKERSDGYLMGYWGYSASRLVKWGINVGKLLNTTTFPINIVNSYEEAVKNAIITVNANVDERQSPCVDWKIKLEGISCSFQLIGEDILLYTAEGDLEEQHLDRLFELSERALKESGIAEKGFYYQIADWRALSSSSQRARKLYIERFRQSCRRYPCRLYIVFGLNRIFQTVIALMGQYFPVRVAIAKNFEDAINIIDKQRVNQAAIDNRKEGITSNLTNKDERQSIEKLLQFMGEINWDIEGSGLLEQDFPLSHPFKPLFEAVSLIKQDFDVLIKEKDKDERIIAEQNKFNKLRAEIWRLAAQKLIDEDVLIQKLLNEIGPVFNVSRACFLRYNSDNEDFPDLICEIEWCNNGIKPTLGNKVPGLLVKHFIDEDVINITPQSALETIPSPLKAIVNPVISTIALIEDIESTSVIAYRLDGKLKGWFSFDICRSQKIKPTMTDEMSKIAQEMVTIISNNVEQKRAEEHVQKAYNEIHQIISAMSSIIIGVDGARMVNQWNEIAARTLELSSSSVIGKEFYTLPIKWDWERISLSTADCLTERKKVRVEDIRMVDSMGKAYILGITLTPLFLKDYEKPGFLLVGSDITERRTLEMQLASSQKMEAVGRLAAGVAHEINTPTQLVGSNLRFLREQLGPILELIHMYDELRQAVKNGSAKPEMVTVLEKAASSAHQEFFTREAPDAIEQSLDGIDRISRIVGAMRYFLHPGKENKEMADLNHIIENTLTVSRNEWKNVAEITTDLTSDLPKVECMPSELSQVLLNLITNAVHAIEDIGGKQPQSIGRILITSRMLDEWVEICVIDSGAGIPIEVRERIFDPFFTTKEVGRGTGQGLAISYNVIVNKHNGMLDFESEIGIGTKFIIRLPRKANYD